MGALSPRWGGWEKLARAQQLGAAMVVDTSDAQWVAKAQSGTAQQGVNLVMDGVNGSVFAGGGAMMGKGSMYVLFGAAGNTLMAPTGEQVMTMIFKNQTLIGHSLNALLAENPAWMQQMLNSLFSEVGAGRLTTMIHPPFHLADAVAAHQAIEARQTMRKVVLHIP